MPTIRLEALQQKSTFNTHHDNMAKALLNTCKSEWRSTDRYVPRRQGQSRQGDGGWVWGRIVAVGEGESAQIRETARMHASAAHLEMSRRTGLGLHPSPAAPSTTSRHLRMRTTTRCASPIGWRGASKNNVSPAASAASAEKTMGSGKSCANQPTGHVSPPSYEWLM